MVTGGFTAIKFMLGEVPIQTRVIYTIIALICIGCSSKNSSNSSTNPNDPKHPASTVGLVPGCGNGVTEANLGEKCDGGPCCDINCQFKSNQMLCDFKSNTYCSGGSATCSKTNLDPGVKYFSKAAGVCPQ